jgi:hypothetical protein
MTPDPQNFWTSKVTILAYTVESCVTGTEIVAVSDIHAIFNFVTLKSGQIWAQGQSNPTPEFLDPDFLFAPNSNLGSISTPSMTLLSAALGQTVRY